jgi:RNA polymerase sigma-70 factor (ECF subfamily)
MTNAPVPNERLLEEGAVTDEFLDDPNERSFDALFKVFSPQLISFFRARTREHALAEDLAQEVMLLVYRNAKQVRDRKLFRAWLFKIAHHALYRHYGKSSRDFETLSLSDMDTRLVGSNRQPGGPAFEFQCWLQLLDLKERDTMMLRYVEQWEYHEIATAQGTPIGTIQWRIFNCKRKLAKHMVAQGSAMKQRCCDTPNGHETGRRGAVASR